VGVMKNFSQTGGVIIFGAGMFKLPRTEMGGGKDDGVNVFEDAGGGMNGKASASRSDSMTGGISSRWRWRRWWLNFSRPAFFVSS